MKFHLLFRAYGQRRQNGDGFTSMIFFFAFLMYLLVTSAGMFFTLWEKNSIKLLTTHIVYIRL